MRSAGGGGTLRLLRAPPYRGVQVVTRSQYSAKEMQRYITAIKDGYHVNWIIDNLPNAAAINDKEARVQKTVYDIGFPVGDVLNEGVELNNHVKIIISYHPPNIGDRKEVRPSPRGRPRTARALQSRAAAAAAAAVVVVVLAPPPSGGCWWLPRSLLLCFWLLWATVA
jgi:hypothetical protein